MRHKESAIKQNVHFHPCVHCVFRLCNAINMHLLNGKAVFRATRGSHLVFRCQFNVTKQDKCCIVWTQHNRIASKNAFISFHRLKSTQLWSILTFMLFVRWVIQPHGDQDEENKERPHNLRQQLELHKSNT